MILYESYFPITVYQGLLIVIVCSNLSPTPPDPPPNCIALCSSRFPLSLVLAIAKTCPAGSGSTAS